ncbi:MAG: hypothetical protein QM754_02355 [Tepidisphaeraceae bacterium]
MERVIGGESRYDLDVLYRGIFGLLKKHVNFEELTAWSPRNTGV